MIVGIPENADSYDIFKADGIDVYIKKGTKTLDGKLTITAEDAFWNELFIVKGIAQ